jgi:hypothetical protein
MSTGITLRKKVFILQIKYVIIFCSTHLFHLLKGFQLVWLFVISFMELPKFHYRVQNSLLLVPVLSQMNSVHIVSPCLLKINFNIVASMCRISKCSLHPKIIYLICILSRVWGSVTNNNAFWIGWLDLLTSSLTITRNHTQLQEITINNYIRLAPFSFILRLFSLLLWLTCFWFTSHSLLNYEWRLNWLPVPVRINPALRIDYLYSL